MADSSNYLLVQDLALRQLQVPPTSDTTSVLRDLNQQLCCSGATIALPPSEILLLVQQLASRQKLSHLDIEGPMTPCTLQNGPTTTSRLIAWEDISSAQNGPHGNERALVQQEDTADF
jgi:hypothetical protein